MSLPFATEDIKYGSDLCFSVGGKIFVGTRISGPFRTGIKCDESDYDLLVELDGIVPMPRLSTTFWIRVENVDALTMQEWEEYIGKSYEYVFSTLSGKVKLSLIASKERPK